MLKYKHYKPRQKLSKVSKPLKVYDSMGFINMLEVLIRQRLLLQVDYQSKLSPDSSPDDLTRYLQFLSLNPKIAKAKWSWYRNSSCSHCDPTRTQKLQGLEGEIERIRSC